MAEVPEVEIYVRDMQSALSGRTILSAEVFVPDTIRFMTAREFSEAIAGAQIQGARRRAKWALVTLDSSRTLAIHCMLFGSLRLEPTTAPLETHCCMALGLDNQEDLRLLDRLGYARAALLPNKELDTRLGLDALGPEALDDSFSPETLAERLAHRRTPVKTALLDQRVVAGMGNRDADESLWRAQIDPRRKAQTLAPLEDVRLTEAMRAILKEGISRRGTMKDLWGQRGTQYEHRQVFERAGEPCPRCGAPITKIRQNGRNTFLCPECQK